MNDDVKKSLIDLIRKVNEKGIKNDAVLYKLVEIEELLYYKIQNDCYINFHIFFEYKIF